MPCQLHPALYLTESLKVVVSGLYVAIYDVEWMHNGNRNGNENISNAPPTVDRRRIT